MPEWRKRAASCSAALAITEDCELHNTTKYAVAHRLIVRHSRLRRWLKSQLARYPQSARPCGSWYWVGTTFGKKLSESDKTNLAGELFGLDIAADPKLSPGETRPARCRGSRIVFGCATILSATSPPVVRRKPRRSAARRREEKGRFLQPQTSL